MTILYHGTSARRRQSIEEKGLSPKLGSYIFASPQRLMALVCATTRAELEGDWGLIVKFHARGKWERDPAFPNSVKSTDAVAPEDIVDLEVVDTPRRISLSLVENLRGINESWKRNCES